MRGAARDLHRKGEPVIRSRGGELWLSALVGRPVRPDAGEPIGRLVDLTVELGDEHPAVVRLGVGRGRRLRMLLPWDRVTSIGPDGVTLAVPPPPREYGVQVPEGAVPLGERELLLARDVLDTEVIDLAGHRLSRVADVLLVGSPTGTLRVAAVDVGVASLVRRLGAPEALTRQRPPVAVDWRDLHLTSSRGHVVQLATDTAGMHRLGAHDLAELLTRLRADQAGDVLRMVGPERAGAAVGHTHPNVGRRLLRDLGDEDADQLVATATTADATAMRRLRERPAPLRGRRFRRLHGWRLHRPPSRRTAP